MNAAKIVRIIALILVLVGAFATIPYEATLLAVAGLAIGYFVADADRVLYFAMVIALATAAATSLDEIPAIGVYLTAILTSLSAVFNAGAVTVIAMRIYERMTE